MKIIELKVRDFLCVEAAEIKPDGNLVVIAGPNEAGKSSVGVKAIWAALGGKDAVPEKPIRDGADRGEIELTIGNSASGPQLLIKRVFTAGGTRLEVSEIREDGLNPEFRSPQKMLSALIESLAFDPHRFATLTPGGQAELLSSITGLDVSGLDAEYKRVFDERRDINRDIKAMGECPAPEGERPAMVDVAEMTDALDSVRHESRAIDRLRDRHAHLVSERHNFGARVTSLRDEIRRLEAEIEGCKKATDANHEESRSIAEKLNSAEDFTEQEQGIRDSIRGAESRNAAVREYDAAMDRAVGRGSLVGHTDGLTLVLDDLKTKRAERIAAVKMPLDGLAIEDGIVTFGGHPVSQASTARQLEIGARIGAAQKPRLRLMCIQQGSLLDAKLMERVGEIADELDMMVMVERVANEDDGTGFYIEEGRIAEREADKQESLFEEGS